MKGATRGLWEEWLIFVVCSQTFALFWLIKTAVPVEIFRLSFHMFACTCSNVIYSFLAKSFLIFLCYPYFSTFFPTCFDFLIELSCVKTSLCVLDSSIYNFVCTSFLGDTAPSRLNFSVPSIIPPSNTRLSSIWLFNLFWFVLQIFIKTSFRCHFI